MGYYEDQLKAYQDKIAGMTSPEVMAKDVASVSGRLGSVASSFGGEAVDIAGGASDVIEKSGQRISRKTSGIAEGFNLNQARTRLANLYNTHLESYRRAGNSLRASDAAARQSALDQFSMEQQAEAAEKDRGFRRQRQDIANQYENAAANLSPDIGNPYEQALMRSLFGLGTTAAAYKFLTREKKPKIQGTTGYTPGISNSETDPFASFRSTDRSGMDLIGNPDYSPYKYGVKIR